MNGTTAAEKSNLITTCLQNFNDTGVIVKSLTFDGAASNISMVKILGAN
ncbi:THAP domain-containing protein 9, partial [Aphis craccivora]